MIECSLYIYFNLFPLVLQLQELSGPYPFCNPLTVKIEIINYAEFEHAQQRKPYFKVCRLFYLFLEYLLRIKESYILSAITCNKHFVL